jgi:hypothetical protein
VRVRDKLALTVLVVVVAASAVAVVSLGGRPAHASPTGLVPGSYNGASPARLFDTRVGLNAPKAALGASAQLPVPVLGHAGVPGSNVASVVVTVTVVSPSGTGDITVWADGAAKPSTSNVRFVAGVRSANLVLTRVGGNGRIRLSNNSPGTVQLIGDVRGYYVGGAATAPGTTVATQPARLVDTRTGLGAPKAAVAAGATLTVTAAGHAGIPASGASAAVLTVSALSPTQSGTVTVWQSGTTRPATLNLSVIAGRAMSDLAVVPLSGGGAFSVRNNTAGTLQLVIDVSGFVRGNGTAVDGGVIRTVTPARVWNATAVPAQSSVAVQVAGRGGSPASNVAAVAVTVTALNPGAAGDLNTWADGSPRPATSAMSFPAHHNVSTLLLAPVGPSGKILLYNNSSVAVQFTGDVTAYYLADKLPIIASTSHYVRNLTGADADASTMHGEGCADAQANAPGNQHLVLLHIGAQNLSGTTWRVQLSATSVVLTDAQLVTAVNGYVDGYASCRTSLDPVTIAVATNNDGADGARDTAAGTEWADNVIDPIAAHAAGNAGMVIAGANDIEPDFTGLESEAEDWTRAFLAATSAPYVFIGAASGCPTTAVSGTCNWGWTQTNFYDLAHGIAPSRILAVPQIYYSVNAQQWKYISLAGASGADRITFAGSLSEYAACKTNGSGCAPGYLTADKSWQALRDALSSSAAINQQRLPVATDLRIDTTPSAPLSAKRVTTAGVS